MVDCLMGPHNVDHSLLVMLQGQLQQIYRAYPFRGVFPSHQAYHHLMISGGLTSVTPTYPENEVATALV